jgi:hypothetical protein
VNDYTPYPYYRTPYVQMRNRDFLSGFLTFFVFIPLFLISALVLAVLVIALVMTAIAVPPVGVMCVRAVCST